MQPIHPIDIHPEDEGDDFVDQYEPGTPWKVIAAVILVLALIIWAIVSLDDAGSTNAPTEPAPSEAPAEPGQ